MYCYLYSLRLSLDFNFHYLHWMIICNRQAGRKTAGLEQPFYKKTDTQISKQSPTLPPHLHKRRLHTCARPLKLAARMLNPAHRLVFFYYYCFHLDAFRYSCSSLPQTPALPMVSHLPHPSGATESHQNSTLQKLWLVSGNTRRACSEKAFASAEAPSHANKQTPGGSLPTEKQK